MIYSKYMINLLKKEETNNYKLFFPLAIPGLLLGVGVWLFPVADSFRRVWHPWLMTWSFLFPIVLGFLWSGIPRFIATEFPGTGFKASYLILILLSWIGVFSNHLLFYKWVVFLSFVGINYWFLLAFRKRKTSPILVIVLLFYALLAALFGSLMLLLAEYGLANGFWIAWGNSLIRVVFFLFLIGSVGSRMIPVMGKKKPPEKKELYLWSFSFAYTYLFWMAIGLMVLLVLSYPVSLEWQVYQTWAKFFILFLFTRDIWLLFRPSQSVSQAFRFLFLALVLIFISPLVSLLPGIESISAKHFLFLSMHLLFVLIVMARVILAHGGHGLATEDHSIIFFAAYSLLVMAVLLRTAAGYFTNYYFWLQIVSAIVITAIFLWSMGIGKAIYFSKKINT